MFLFGLSSFFPIWILLILDMANAQSVLVLLVKQLDLLSSTSFMASFIFLICWWCLSVFLQITRQLFILSLCCAVVVSYSTSAVPHSINRTCFSLQWPGFLFPFFLLAWMSPQAATIAFLEKKIVQKTNLKQHRLLILTCTLLKAHCHVVTLPPINHAGLYGMAPPVFSLTKQTVSCRAGIAFARVNTVLLVVMVFVFVWTLCLVYVCCWGQFRYANVLVVPIRCKLTIKCCND